LQVVREGEQPITLSPAPPTATNNSATVSASKAAKETADLLPPALLSYGAMKLSLLLGHTLTAEELGAVLTALTCLWKFASKFLRDYTKKR
jgi:hypothetical protein